MGSGKAAPAVTEATELTAELKRSLTHIRQ